MAGLSYVQSSRSQRSATATADEKQKREKNHEREEERVEEESVAHQQEEYSSVCVPLSVGGGGSFGVAWALQQQQFTVCQCSVYGADPIRSREPPTDILHNNTKQHNNIQFNTAASLVGTS